MASTGPESANKAKAAADAPGDGLVLVNRLSESRSPYVRGHMNNPVAWQEWSPDALELAKKHDRLIFLSVGYAACHWCHVMERESFENPEIAAFLNKHFIPIKLDREERPDLDRIYMNYVQATTGGGGWPLNVFLTPALAPLFGGTYWPGPDSTSAHRDHVGFLDILRKMEQVWRAQRQRCRESASEIADQLREFAQEGLVSREGLASQNVEGGDVLELELLDEAYEYFASRFDESFGGFGSAPKFPTPVNLQFLLALGQYPQAVTDILDEKDVEKAKNMVVKTLEIMWKGGIKDQIGNGFSRYSVTRDWSLPHFEKMLYDQAQLLPIYLDAYLLTQSPTLLPAVLDIATYLTSPPLAAPAGGFFSSEDADSLSRPGDAEKREGAFYVWTRRELTTLLGDRDAQLAARYWGISDAGNVPREHDAHDELLSQNVLAVRAEPEAVAREFGVPREEVVRALERARKTMRAWREKERPAPALDDKIVLAWNGLAIGALARTSAALEGLDAVKYAGQIHAFREAAEKAAAFVKREMRDEKTGLLRRIWREGPADAPAFADDYAFLISGLIDLYEATWDDGYLEWADEVLKKQIELFWDDKHGGFFSTAAGQADLILRLKDGMDNAEPSTNGVSARNIFRLASILGDEQYTDRAKRTLHAFEAEIMQYPHLFVSLLDCVVSDRLGVKDIVITGTGEAVERELNFVRARPGVSRTVVRLGAGVKDKWIRERNQLLKAMDPDKAGVQVCEGGVCQEVLSLEKEPL